MTQNLRSRLLAGELLISTMLTFPSAEIAEMTALAAGHRPCDECQRERAQQFRAAGVQRILNWGTAVPSK